MSVGLTEIFLVSGDDLNLVDFFMGHYNNLNSEWWLYIVHFALYIVYCAVYIVQCTN